MSAGTGSNGELIAYVWVHSRDYENEICELYEEFRIPKWYRWPKVVAQIRGMKTIIGDQVKTIGAAEFHSVSPGNYYVCLRLDKSIGADVTVYAGQTAKVILQPSDLPYSSIK